ncbi:hypothetical protein AC792_09620 [Arthrobacter sp. RIT-PI-e]|uniref:hypothetical protein n=1 Tax=Arthrobacter sp. RIT-PI-e TaxID=1681197 RepID=UPI0006A1EB02|nr:hypothetical protein [Arthrobacter sp. RIT-PI-e]KNC18943.1 hypothetical protein AC792_09620 [Arthrobacter sp. RIT-PI-e]
MRLSPSLTAVLCASLGGSLLLAGCASSEETTTAEESPLTQYFSAAYGGDLSPEEQEEQFREDNREREELVAQCMTEEGFEYIPNVQNASFMSGGEWEPDSREWVAQYGYGMINYPGRDEPVPEEEQYVDANQDYIESLSESEQTAFFEALHGPMPDEEAMMSDEPMEYDWTTAGCFGWAENERGGGEDPFSTEEHKPLMDAMDEFYQNTMDSPELAEIDAAWSSCMSDAGHPGFSAQYDAQTSINEASNALYESSAGAAPEEMVMPDEAAMADLGEKEIELALADLDCREETDYRERQQEVQFEQEQQFVDDHQDQLEALKADIEQGR